MSRRGLVPLLLLAGCAASTPGWEKVGSDAATRDKDLAACQQELRYTGDEARRRDSRIAAARGELGLDRSNRYETMRGDMDASTQRRREGKALANCMQAKGYASRS